MFATKRLDEVVREGDMVGYHFGDDGLIDEMRWLACGIADKKIEVARAAHQGEAGFFKLTPEI